MTLLITPGDGYAQVTDGAHVTHDTRDKLLHVVSSLTGSESFATKDWSGSGVTATRTSRRTLGSVHADSQVVFGGIKLANGGQGQINMLPVDSGWLMAGGTFVYVFKTFQTISAAWGTRPSSIVIYSFVVESGVVYLDEDLRLYDDTYSGNNFAMRSIIMTYKLFTGVFT